MNMSPRHSYSWIIAAAMIAAAMIILNISCVTQSQLSCQPASIIADKNPDGRHVPYRSAVHLKSINYSKKIHCKDDHCFASKSTMASGVFIYRSTVDRSIGFLLTANHFCKFADEKDHPDGYRYDHNVFMVSDASQQTHIATRYFTSEKSDICVLIVKDLQPDVDIASIASKMPAMGERVFNVASPGGFLRPGVSLIFEGLFSGVDDADGDVVYTLPTAGGSSGSGIFNAKGQLIGLTKSVPTQSVTDDDDNEKTIPILESICYAASLSQIKDAYNSIVTVDDVFGLTLTSSSTHH